MRKSIGIGFGVLLVAALLVAGGWYFRSGQTVVTPSKPEVKSACPQKTIKDWLYDSKDARLIKVFAKINALPISKEKKQTARDVVTRWWKGDRSKMRGDVLWTYWTVRFVDGSKIDLDADYHCICTAEAHAKYTPPPPAPKPASVRHATDLCIGIPVDVRGLDIARPLRPRISLFGPVNADEVVDDQCSYAVDGKTGERHRLTRDCPSCNEGASAVLTTLIPSGHGVVYFSRRTAALVDIEFCYFGPGSSYALYHDVYEREEFLSALRAGQNRISLQYPKGLGE